jgi:hypothetical protein
MVPNVALFLDRSSRPASLAKKAQHSRANGGSSSMGHPTKDPPAELKADCSQCDALCCVSLAFDRGESFSFDKDADAPCQHLQSTNRCEIHETLEARGQLGCATYDCYGAGQRVTQQLFRDVSWRRNPTTRRALFAAFRDLKHVHELRLLLSEAGRLELGSDHAELRAKLLAQLQPEAGLSVESLRALDIPVLHAQTHAFLRDLRGYFGKASRSKRRLGLVS